MQTVMGVSFFTISVWLFQYRRVLNQEWFFFPKEYENNTKIT